MCFNWAMVFGTSPQWRRDVPGITIVHHAVGRVGIPHKLLAGEQVRPAVKPGEGRVDMVKGEVAPFACERLRLRPPPLEMIERHTLIALEKVRGIIQPDEDRVRVSKAGTHQAHREIPVLLLVELLRGTWRPGWRSYGWNSADSTAGPSAKR